MIRGNPFRGLLPSLIPTYNHLWFVIRQNHHGFNLKSNRIYDGLFSSYLLSINWIINDLGNLQKLRADYRAEKRTWGLLQWPEMCVFGVVNVMCIMWLFIANAKHLWSLQTPTTVQRWWVGVPEVYGSSRGRPCLIYWRLIVHNAQKSRKHQLSASGRLTRPAWEFPCTFTRVAWV